MNAGTNYGLDSADAVGLVSDPRGVGPNESEGCPTPRCRSLHGVGVKLSTPQFTGLLLNWCVYVFTLRQIDFCRKINTDASTFAFKHGNTVVKVNCLQKSATDEKMKKIHSAIAAVVLITVHQYASADWRFYAERKESTIFLAEEKSTLRGCEGKLDASEQRYALEKWVHIRDLCYELNKSGDVRLTDPNKIFPPKSFTISSNEFARIPTKEERLTEQRRQELEQQNQGAAKVIRQMHESNLFRRRGFTCLNSGEIITCD